MEPHRTLQQTLQFKPGMMVSDKSLLDKNSHPTEENCKQALSGISTAAEPIPAIPPSPWKQLSK
jgi:hypothetical protein